MANHAIIYQFMTCDQEPVLMTVKDLKCAQVWDWWQRNVEKSHVDRIVWMGKLFKVAHRGISRGLKFLW